MSPFPPLLLTLHVWLPVRRNGIDLLDFLLTPELFSPVSAGHYSPSSQLSLSSLSSRGDSGCRLCPNCTGTLLGELLPPLHSWGRRRLRHRSLVPTTLVSLYLKPWRHWLQVSRALPDCPIWTLTIVIHFCPCLFSHATMKSEPRLLLKCGWMTAVCCCWLQGSA